MSVKYLQYPTYVQDVWTCTKCLVQYCNKACGSARDAPHSHRGHLDLTLSEGGAAQLCPAAAYQNARHANVGNQVNVFLSSPFEQIFARTGLKNGRKGSNFSIFWKYMFLIGWQASLQNHIAGHDRHSLTTFINQCNSTFSLFYQKTESWNRAATSGQSVGYCLINWLITWSLNLLISNTGWCHTFLCKPHICINKHVYLIKWPLSVLSPCKVDIMSALESVNLSKVMCLVTSWM